MNIQDLHTQFLTCTEVCTDTRKLQKGALYFALKGEHFDGNTYALSALAHGAKYAVVDDPSIVGENIMYCENSLKCLQNLATYHRNFLGIPIISITGSNGKTTTKKLVLHVLQQKYKAQATRGNLNNHIGVPLTILSFTKETEIGIVEMGANHQGEIAFLSQLAQPNYGYITNFGKAHLEGFGGIEGVVKGKSELYDYINATQGNVFVNANDELQMQKTKHLQRFTIGSNASADCLVTLLETQPNLVVSYKNQVINSPLLGHYNFSNIAAAIGIGEFFSLSFEHIKKGIETFTTEENRSQLINTTHNQVLLDAYNANPSSMQVAIENFSAMKASNKVVILGDMFELGEEAILEHKEIIKWAMKHDFESVLLCGELFYEAHQQLSSSAKAFQTFSALMKELEKSSLQGKTIFIKASRGMALERCLTAL